MSLTSYQAAPPRALKVVSMCILRKSKNVCSRETHDENAIEFAFTAAATSLMCERTNSCRYGELVGSRFRGALVSKENAGERSARLVRAAFRVGRGERNLLFRSGTAN